MTDIVERLRAISLVDLRAGPILAHTLDTAREAADEIERLRADNIDWARQNLQNVRNEVNRDVNKAMADEIERLRTALDGLSTIAKQCP